jgi:hypothetical protein
MTEGKQDIVERLKADLEEIQEWDRPLPWVVHSGSSYRRIASLPTRENLRSFPDGNVLHGTIQRSDGHPDLSMGEEQLCALVRLVNAIPEAAALISSLLEALEECADKLWVLRCNSRDPLDREAAERAFDMATAAIAKVKP